MAFEVKRLNKAFGIGGHRRRVVRSFSMKVSEGEIVAVVGKKGSGKSTLMSMLIGLLRPDSGSIIVDGHKIHYWNPFQRSILRTKRVGVVTKDSLLIGDMTVYENLMAPMDHTFKMAKAKMRRAKEVLRAVGLRGKGKYYPADLEDIDVQKVCLARALMLRPKYLILDEPTANLQSADVDRFMDLVEILNSNGFTIIVLTHSRRVANHCQRLIPIASTAVKEEPEEEEEEEEEDDESDEDEDDEEEEEVLKKPRRWFGRKADADEAESDEDEEDAEEAEDDDVKIVAGSARRAASRSTSEDDDYE